MKTNRIFGMMVFAALTAVPALANEGADPAQAVAAAGALDGKSFAVKLTMGDKVHETDFNFDGGMFTSVACKEQGFEPAAYTAKVEGDKTVVSATLTKGEDTHTLSATVTGDAISGSFDMKDGGTETKATFEGALKK